MAFSQKIVDLKKEVLAESQELLAHVDAIAEENTLKVLDAMRECKVSDAHFNTTSGYAYDDIGRSKLEELYAKIFGAERALVRTQFVSGTHALATVLFGILRPGDELVSLTGKPYDTMQTVIGYDNPSPGSLKEFGVLYNELPMIDGKVDMDGIKNVISVQPFGCMANQIISKGIEKKLRKKYPDLNLLFLDYDDGASDVNITNRLYFMLKNL